MALITKAEATALATTFKQSEAQRLNQYLTNLAQSGIVGGTYTYSSIIPDPQANAAGAALTAAGWTAAVDTVAKTITVS